MKAYSLDLRQRVLSAALRGDRTIPEVAELFGVSMTFVNKMLRLHRAGDDLAPRPHGGGHTPRLGRATIGCCARPSPRTTTPRSASCASTWLAKSRVSVSDSTVSRALKALGLPRKKKHEGGGAQQL